MAFDSVTDNLSVRGLRNELKLKKYKFIFIFLNTTFLIFSVLLISLMISLGTYWGYYEPFLTVYTDVHSFGVIFTCSFACFVAFVGYLIVYLGKSPHYIWYGLGLVLMIIIELKTIFYGVFTNPKAEKYVGRLMENATMNYLNDSIWRESMDFLQLSMVCCGVTNKTNWLNTPLGSIPGSCCSHFYPQSYLVNGLNTPCDNMPIFEDPCLPKLLQFAGLGVILIYSILSIMLCLKVLNLLTTASVYYKNPG